MSNSKQIMDQARDERLSTHGSYLKHDDKHAVKLARIVVLCSANLDANVWAPVEPSEVPEFIKEPETMGRLIKGEVCQCSVLGHDEMADQDLWYRAEKCDG
jgi:hypothetical protein